MKEKKQVAIYLRLSVEDAACEADGKEKQKESGSIFSQRKMLLDYIRRDDTLAAQEITEFCDDGFTGTNMERPGIQALLERVRQGEISCILVKDMSRFSRDYIELGTYLNQIFPFMGVRFIAVNDRYDSREQEGAAIGLDTAFRTLLYDLYSKDISVKVKSSFQKKCAAGEYIFGQAPLGYAKSRSEKNKIIVNEKEARIVRYIFALAEEGRSSTQIAKRLIEEQIPTAARLRFPERKTGKEYFTWSGAAVRNILNNRFYLGEMAYGKSIGKSVGGKKRSAVPKGDWKVIPNHHEPLVTPEVFARAVSVYPGRSTKRKREKHPLTGKIYCGGCGYALNYKPRGKDTVPPHFWCRKHALLQLADCCTYFNADVLEGLVSEELLREIRCGGSLDGQEGSLERFRKEVLARLHKNRETCMRQYRALRQKKDSLYESYALRQLEVSEYQSKAAELDCQMRELKKRVEEIKSECSRIEDEAERLRQGIKERGALLYAEKLTPELVDTFVKKITVYKNKCVEIEWNFMMKGMTIN